MADAQPRRIEFKIDPSWDDLREFWIYSAYPDGGWKYRWLGHHSWRSNLIALGMCGAAAVLLILLVPTTAAAVSGGVVFGGQFLYYILGLKFAPDRTTDRGWAQVRGDPGVSGMVGPRVLTFDDACVNSRTEAGRVAQVDWAGIERIVAHAGAVYVFESLYRALIVPAAALGGEEDAEDLAAFLERWRSAARPAREPKAPGGELISPTFDMGEQELRAAAETGRPSLVPGAGTILSVAISGFVAFAMWPWWRAPVAMVVGPFAALSAAWSLVGAPVMARRRIGSVVRAQLDSEVVRRGHQSIRLGFDAAGIHESSPASRTFEPWSAIIRVEPREDVTLFVNNTSGVCVLPAAAFADLDAYFDFVEKALAYRRAGLANAA